MTLVGVVLTEETLNALFEAVCGDAMFLSERDGTVRATFDRAAPSPEDAVLTAIRDVQNSDTGACVVRVNADDDWLTATEIAVRVGRTRASIRHLVLGQRDPRGFPPPVARADSQNPLWSWSDVENWFEKFSPGELPPHRRRLSAGFLAEVNNLVDRSIRPQERRQ